MISIPCLSAMRVRPAETTTASKLCDDRPSSLLSVDEVEQLHFSQSTSFSYKNEQLLHRK